MINDIFYYGYIDITGKEIIPPQFLNATNFVDGYAIIIAPSNEIIGFNEILKKDIVKKQQLIKDYQNKFLKVFGKHLSGYPVSGTCFGWQGRGYRVQIRQTGSV